MTTRDLDLVLFRGFGGDRLVCLAGRVIAPSQLVPNRDDTKLWRRVREGWRLLISRRVARVLLELQCGGQTWQTQTDRHGYFFSCQKIASAANRDVLWSEYNCRVISVGDGESIQATAEVLRASSNAERLIISDIDDTSIYTGVANKLKMLWHLYISRAEDRKPFPGMVAFLRGLHHGGNGQAINPMLYVSRSPWSIYPMLDEFFNHHEIPIGPVLLLRDWGISWRYPLPRKAEDHKSLMIDRVMQAYPELPVVLIGDSGQHDPEVYVGVVDRYPERVCGIYIRDLSPGEQRSTKLARMAEQLQSRHVPFLASNDTETLVTDAIERGWILPKAQRDVRLQAEAEKRGSASV